MQAAPEALRAALAGRYEVERELGQGGMAAVYLARDVRHHRRVAIKVIRPDVSAALGSERFLREIETAASLTHPNILPVHDSGEAGGFLYFVMPYVEGESLRARLERERQLPIDDALQIAREVADALNYAHSHGIVHRDIKPANILLESGHAVVADFGIARAVSAASGETLTETGMTLGTPAYMSPEQASGSKNFDGRSDLYSLGCVLYEMLAGQPPFTGPTTESLVHQHLSAAPRPVTDIRPSVPVLVAAALQRALSKAPADRPSATLFVSALTHYDSNAQPVVMPAPSAASPSIPQPVAAPAPPLRRGWIFPAAGLLAVAVLAAGLYLLRPWARPAAPVAAGHPRTAIAVLPPQNLSAEGPNAYFAGGLHDELLTQLAKVASLKVISRTSVMSYQGTAKPLKQIADELGVGSIVEGSVQVVGTRLRVNVQLIDAATDQHLWAERYDRTLDDAFAIQSDLAQKIVTAVGAALSIGEQDSLAAAPTTNAEAYRLYLQGREYVRRPGYLRSNLERAEQLFQQAVALDPNFALAHATLSRVHGRMHWFRYDPTPQRAERQRTEAETALRLAGDLPQSHLAMGEARYQTRRDWRGALDEYTIASHGLPNDAELWEQIGYAHRRLGEWDAVFAALEKATQLNPRGADLYWDLGGFTYQLVRRYAEAVRAYEHALSLAPNLHIAAVFRGWTYARWHGRLDIVEEALARVPAGSEIASQGTVEAHRAALLLWERDAEGLRQEISGSRHDVFVGQWHYLPVAMYAAWGSRLRGQDAAAQSEFDAACVLLDAARKGLPEDWRVHAARGLALAGLGRRDEALGEARWLQQSEVYRADAYEGPLLAEDRARILAQAGYADEALDEIERLLAKPSWLSVHTLRLDPRWDPIRDHPRFQALLNKYGS